MTVGGGGQMSDDRARLEELVGRLESGPPTMVIDFKLHGVTTVKEAVERAEKIVQRLAGQPALDRATYEFEPQVVNPAGNPIAWEVTVHCVMPSLWRQGMPG